MPNRKIYLLRHGKAESTSATGRDFDRSLTGEGRDILRASARGMVALGVEIDLLVSSPLVRAVQTADELAPAFAGVRRDCLLYTSPSPRDKRQSRMPSSA